MMIHGNTKHEMFRKRIDEVEQIHDYAGLTKQVDELYEGLGVTVMRGISKAGEDPVQIFMPEKSSYPNYPA